MNAMNIPDAVLEGAAKLETHGFRYVRIAPNGAGRQLGYTVYLCKEIPTGLRVARVKVDANGEVMDQQ